MFETVKICPLNPRYYTHCYEDECAWWMAAAQSCAIPLLASALDKESLPPLQKGEF